MSRKHGFCRNFWVRTMPPNHSGTQELGLSQPTRSVCHEGYGRKKLINSHGVAGQHEILWRDHQSNPSKYNTVMYVICSCTMDSCRIVITVDHLGLVLVLVSVKGHEESWILYWLMIPLHGKVTFCVCYMCHLHRLNHILPDSIFLYFISLQIVCQIVKEQENSSCDLLHFDLFIQYLAQLNPEVKEHHQHPVDWCCSVRQPLAVGGHLSSNDYN